MKQLIIIIAALLPVLTVSPQTSQKAAPTATQPKAKKYITARQVLDKAAAVVGRKGGASAQFTISGAKIGSSSGTVAIKGNKFKASTPDAVVWYNGTTQWTYMPQTEEVNITTPDKEQQAALNPYTFINIYKEGFRHTIRSQGNSYVVTLKATDSSRNIREMVITVTKGTYVPTQVKMLQGGDWTTIAISHFKAADQPDRLFTFNAKDYPEAEVIDLRD